MSTFVIDPGHGGAINGDPGAVNGTRQEKNDTLKLGLAVQNLLQAQGHTALLTRSTDTYVSLAARTNYANKTGAELFVSLHRNSFTNSTANGVEIWVYTTDGAVPVAAATEVLERLVDAGVQSNRGIKKGNYHVVRETKMTAMLIELNFISNTKDNELFDTNFDKYAEAIARGMVAAVGGTWKTPAIDSGSNGANSGASTGLYRVQVGAFSSESNARAFLKTVQDMGIPAFLVIPGEAKSE